MNKIEKDCVSAVEESLKLQSDFNYRDMGDDSLCDIQARRSLIKDAFGPPHDFEYYNGEEMVVESSPGQRYFDDYTMFDKNKRPIFPGYKFENGKSTYRGEDVGEGGYVYAEPGIYGNVALLDIASMHPSSIVAEELFGKKYTARFNDILNARIAIKHKDFDKARTMLDGKLAPYLDDENQAKDLAQALKIAINSVYGLTTANFENPFRDIRNIDNIVAKRGALFMINLKHEVQKRGFTVAHIKTDSIKIPDATPEIIEFVTKYGKMYGYNFEHEATYERMCLVNDAVYIAKYKDGKNAGKWTATGTQFAVPYVFKTLFSHEPIEFEDMCETKSVSSALYLDMNEGLPNVEVFEKVKFYRKCASDQLSRAEENTLNAWRHLSDEELTNRIAEGHSYRFVGKVGSFCPMKPGCGSGLLVRETENKKTGEKGYPAVTGTKGYRWMESEMVKSLGREDDIDISFYQKLVDDAAETIRKYGDFENFVSDEPVPSTPIFWPPKDMFPHGMPCGKDNCFGCPEFSNGMFDIDCRLGYDVYPF